MLGKAVMAREVAVTEWHGVEYPYDNDDAAVFEKGEEVEVLKEAGYNDLGNKLYVIFSSRLKESTVVYEKLIQFVK